ncbi:MAG TPA: DUF502 domain-containing protein [Luteimonas sp.]|nr:DUF502 domain-containing protein [Luteimonas sp.]
MPDLNPSAPAPSSPRLQRPTFQRLFLTGLLTLLPIWLTWVVVKFVFVLLSDTSRPLIGPLLHNLAAGNAALGWLDDPWVQTAIALLATLGVILLSGVMARRVVGQRLLRWFEALVGRIPLARTIYGSARKLLDILQTQPDGTQRVVLIDFPHTEMKSVGFVTRILREQGTGRELAAVYVPTTPNPTSGYLEVVPVEKLTPTDWTVDQAMSFIISGGAVSPDTIPFSTPGELRTRL